MDKAPSEIDTFSQIIMTAKEKTLIQACIKKDEQAQTELYEQYKAKMYAVCLRYARTKEEAEDFLVEGFFKVFKDLHQFNYQSPLVFWIKKVIVNTALMSLRKKRVITFPTTDLIDNELQQVPEIWQQLAAETILQAIQSLPAGYQTIFNLYAIEGYSHKEIGEQLGIAESTSRSQYTRAKKALQQLLAPQKSSYYGQ